VHTHDFFFTSDGVMHTPMVVHPFPPFLAIKSIQFVSSDPALRNLIDAECVEDLVQSVVLPHVMQLEVLTTLLVIASFNANLLLECDIIPEMVELEPAMHKESLVKTLHLFWNIYVTDVERTSKIFRDAATMHFFVKCCSASHELVVDSALQLICHSVNDSFSSVLYLGENTIQTIFSGFLLERQPKVCPDSLPSFPPLSSFAHDHSHTRIL
jgi:hypothetical protein